VIAPVWDSFLATYPDVHLEIAWMKGPSMS